MSSKHVHAFGSTFADLIVTSLGFVAALSWNDYIKSLFMEGGIFHNITGSKSLLAVALVVTVVAFVCTYLVSRFFPDCIEMPDTKFKKRIRELKEKEELDSMLFGSHFKN